MNKQYKHPKIVHLEWLDSETISLELRDRDGNMFTGLLERRYK